MPTEDVGSYLPRSTRRTRRTRAEMYELRDRLYRIVEEDQPMTVRQVFYRAVSEGLIEKTMSEYHGVIIRLLKEMRLSGSMRWTWIADSTRWMRKPSTWSSLDAFLTSAQLSYRRDLWDRQGEYVEIWLEKDALAGVLSQITMEYDVPLMVTRGYPSLTYQWDAAAMMAELDKPCFIYYFGDHDPSGRDISETTEARLRDFLTDWPTSTELHFERVAVEPRQIEDWNLPSRPTKKGDPRARNFEGESVEVDAIKPQVLRDLTRRCIEDHIDPEELSIVKGIEKRERDVLSEVMRTAHSSLLT